MTHALAFIRFRSPGDKGWEAAMELYCNSFPAKEIRSEEDHLRALADPDFYADGIWLDGLLAGIFYYWQMPNGLCYGEHLAVSPALRGKNIGSELLKAYCSSHRIVLEIDPPEEEIAIRRQHFYQRLGFQTNPHRYIHPSFREPFEAHRLVLMSYPSQLTDEEAQAFAQFVRERVLLYSEHRATPTTPILP